MPSRNRRSRRTKWRRRYKEEEEAWSCRMATQRMPKRMAR
jgi:hypothetical protein